MSPAKSQSKPKSVKPKVFASRKRVRKVPEHKSFRLSKRIRNPRPALPGVHRIWSQTFRLIYANKKLFLGIIAVHVVLSVIFVRGFGISTEFTDLKTQVDELLGGSVNQLGTSLALFSYLATTAATQASEVAGAYRVFLTFIATLAIIWAARQVLAGKKTTIREAFYSGMYPLIPFMLVLFVIGLQLIPAIIGNMAYGFIVSGGLAITTAEKLIVLIFFLLLLLLSFYMIISSVFALCISTLPDMTPMKALRSARGLVLYRRWSVGLRLIALPMVLLVLALITIMPLIIFIPVLAEPVFFLAGSIGLLLGNLYIYNLYRALL